MKTMCSECNEPSNIEALFTREPYCGRKCLAEGQLKYVRMILRMRAEELHNGELAS